MHTKVIEQWVKRARLKKEFAFLKALEKKSGVQVYLVGGFVRDLLLGRPSKDIDFVVAGISQKKLMSVLQKYGSVSFVGKTFGVFKFVPKDKHGDEAFDIALPRLDVFQGNSGAYRDVKVKAAANIPIEEDLQRRDYTVNALAWNLIKGGLVDLGQGVGDLKAKRLRTVGDPAKRFQEDYSRLLRGLRFAAELNFSFEPKTWRVLKNRVRHLNDKKEKEYIVPREVVARELLKTFYADPVLALRLYDTSGALSVLIPELYRMKKCPQPKPFHMEGDVWQHTELALARFGTLLYRKHFSERPDAEIIMAALFHDIGKPYTLKTPQKHGVDRVRFDGHDVVGARLVREIGERLKFSSQPAGTPLHVNIDNLAWLIHYHLLLLHDRAREMKLTTIEKYFVRHPAALKLQQLIMVDSLATIPKSGRPYMKHLQTLWTTLKKMNVHGTKAPKALLSGDEILKLGVPEGPTVGLLLRRLREEQLMKKIRTKMAAKQFIKKAYALMTKSA